MPVHSFDKPRERPAPSVLRGRSAEGEAFEIVLRSLTLVVAIKPDCDGCRDFVEGDLVELDHLEVVLVSATSSDEWARARRPVLIAPELLTELEIRAAPVYVLIDPARERVLSEGALFSPAQVASEIASYVVP